MRQYTCSLLIALWLALSLVACGDSTATPAAPARPTITVSGAPLIQLYPGLKPLQPAEAVRKSFESSFITAFNSIVAGVNVKSPDFNFKYYATSDSVNPLADFYNTQVSGLGYTRIVNQDTTTNNLPVKVVAYTKQNLDSKKLEFFELQVIGPVSDATLTSLTGFEVKSGESLVFIVQGSVISGG